MPPIERLHAPTSEEVEDIATQIAGRVNEHDLHASLGQGSRWSAHRLVRSSRSQTPKAIALQVAALYSGRFFGLPTSASVAGDHLDNFIRPNDVDVFLTSDPTTWCDAPSRARTAFQSGDMRAAEAALVAQATDAFDGWRKLHVALIPAEEPSEPHSFGSAGIEAAKIAVRGLESRWTRATGRAGLFMHSWFMQYEHVAKTEALRRAYGPHDVVVRLRFDVAFTVPLTFLADSHHGVRVISNATQTVMRLRRDVRHRAAAAGQAASPLSTTADIGVYGFASYRPDTGGHPVRCVPEGEEINVWSNKGMRAPACPAGRPTLWMWSDWMYVGTPQSLSVLAQMTSTETIYYTNDTNVRCLGLCQEEQTAIHLEKSGVSVLPMSLPLQMRKPMVAPCGSEPLLSASDLATHHQITGFYVPCPPARTRGCRAKNVTTSEGDAEVALRAGYEQ